MSLSNRDLDEQAKALVRLLPAVMGRLFLLNDRVTSRLPLTQLRVCVLLADGPRTMSALNRELGVSLSAMTQIANRLERAGLVRRVADPKDRRSKHLQLTGRGRSLVQSREEAHTRRLAEVLAALPPERRDEVQDALETLLDACTRVGEPPDGSPLRSVGIFP